MAAPSVFSFTRSGQFYFELACQQVHVRCVHTLHVFLLLAACIHRQVDAAGVHRDAATHSTATELAVLFLLRILFWLNI